MNKKQIRITNKQWRIRKNSKRENRMNSIISMLKNNQMSLSFLVTSCDLFNRSVNFHANAGWLTIKYLYRHSSIKIRFWVLEFIFKTQRVWQNLYSSKRKTQTKGFQTNFSHKETQANEHLMFYYFGKVNLKMFDHICIIWVLFDFKMSAIRCIQYNKYRS